MESSLNLPTPQFIQEESDRLKKEGAKDVIQLLTNVFGPEAVSHWLEWVNERIAQKEKDSKTT